MVQFAEKSQETHNSSLILALQASADHLQKYEIVATM